MLHPAHSISQREREREREREMSNHRRFKLSHLMPNSWFYKLKDMKRPRPPNQRSSEMTRSSKRSNHYSHGTITPKPLPLSPHQFYHYSKAKEMPSSKLRPSLLHLNPKATDIQFPQNHNQHLHDHHRSPISRGSAITEGNSEFQDLQLRPIRTRPEPSGSTTVNSATSSGTCPSSPKLRSRRLHVTSGGRVSTSNASGRRSVARKSFAIVKASMDPRRDFRESMVEMITENKVHAPEDFQELLQCYLSLNSREYHGVIMEVFRAIWLEIA